MDVSLPAHRRERACVQLFDVMTLLKTSLYKGGWGYFAKTTSILTRELKCIAIPVFLYSHKINTDNIRLPARSDSIVKIYFDCIKPHTCTHPHKSNPAYRPTIILTHVPVHGNKLYKKLHTNQAYYEQSRCLRWVRRGGS